MNDTNKNPQVKQNQKPVIRNFVDCQRNYISSANGVTILQWNILADILSTSSPTENFYKVPADCLDWTYRKNMIIDVIVQTSADIVCLQEVDRFEDILTGLNKYGYEGKVHLKKDSPCLKFHNNHGPDGLAMFYRKDKFDVKYVKQVYLSDENGDEVSPMMNMKFLIKNTNIQFVVATLHLKAKHGFETRRLKQSESALNHLLSIGEDSIVLCGDFNAEESEPSYQLLSSDDRLNLHSVYKSVLGEEPLFTTWKIRPTGEIKHTIDYMWFTPTTIFAEAVLAPLTDKDVPTERFPSFNHPSDHTALACKLSFITPTNNGN